MHKTQAPLVRLGATTVSGSLPGEVIRRIVRQSFGRFRQCYERELATNPAAEGQVRVAFAIGTEGNVTSATATGMSPMLDGCIARAFRNLSFPMPEGSPVRVVFPLRFAPSNGATVSSWQPPRNSWGRGGWSPAPQLVVATHRAAGGTSGPLALAPSADVERLEARLSEAPESRPRHEKLVRALLLHGHFEGALVRARQFAEADPDDPHARELYAFALSASGLVHEAARAMSSLAEVEPTSASAQLRAARAFVAVGDKTRACAHFEAASALDSSDAVVFEALRCRAERDGTHAEVLEEARAQKRPGALVRSLVDTLDKGAPLPEPARRGGAFVAKVVCSAGASCPSAIVVTPNGSVIAPWTPSSTLAPMGATSLGIGRNGSYRTFLVGGTPGARGTLELAALGTVRTFPFDYRSGTTPVAATEIAGL
jgi:Ca-activated chloride channel family protein